MPKGTTPGAHAPDKIECHCECHRKTPKTKAMVQVAFGVDGPAGVHAFACSALAGHACRGVRW